MSENSDGRENDVKKTAKSNKAVSGKTRSFSLGSSEMSKSQINKIIGIRDNEAEKIKASDNNERNSSRNTDLPRTLDKFDINYRDEKISESNECNLFAEYTDVFKSKNSVARTPPTQNEKSAETTYKRPRSENTPETEKITKRQRDKDSSGENNSIINLNIPASEKEKNVVQKSETSTENVIIEFFAAIDNIQKLLESKNSNSDIHSVGSSINTVSKSFSLLVYKLGKIEKENMTLKYRLNVERYASDKDGSDQDIPIAKIPVEQPDRHQPLKKTYATITQSNPRPEAKLENQEWKTPETKRKKMETVIHIDQVTDSKETIRQLKSEISTNDVGGAFKNIRHLKSGAIVVESCSETQQEKLKSVLEKKSNIKIKESQSTNPMFVITGIQKGFSNNEFVSELVRLNNEIETELSYTVTDKITVIAKKACRNPAKENWILQAPAEISKWFLKKQTVTFDLIKVYVQEHINLAMCFRCAGFGHVAKYCNETQCCHKCGGQHFGKDCQSNELKCPNCKKMKHKLEESHHTARDIHCPVYKRRVQNFRDQIYYSSSFL